MPEPSRILVVDAERHIVRLAQTNLGRAGYHVITSSSGKKALAKAESEKPDIIVLGAIPPPVDAAELLKRLRAHEATKGVRVVRLTGKVSDLDLSDDRELRGIVAAGLCVRRLPCLPRAKSRGVYRMGVSAAWLRIPYQDSSLDR